MKQSLNLRLSQHLALTPQLQQSIKLLQLSTLELQQEIEHMLELNPFLEPEEEHPGEASANPELPGPGPGLAAGSATGEAANGSEGSEARSGDADDSAEAPLQAPEWQADGNDGATESNDWDDAPGGTWQGSGEGEGFDAIDAAQSAQDLRDHLRQQLAGLSLSAIERAAAEAVIDSLDDDGYLLEGVEQLAADLGAGVDAEQHEALAGALRIGLCLVQSFDPPGVGATSLAESMLLQLQRLPDSPARALAVQLCAGGHLELLSKRDWKRLGRALQADETQLRAAQQLIARLDPRPGARFNAVAAHSVVPDVIAQRNGSRWHAVLNPDVLPRLRINTLYAELLRRARDGGGLSGQLQEARWFVRNVQQRFETIERVAQAVVERQQLFFSQGELGMRPLVLREIADELGLHESTISRVTTQKFMLTPHGTFELKYFFGSGLATDTGGNASSTAVRAIIRSMVQGENPAAPLSDGEIAERLAAQGISVARRTVAKYREALRIPPAPQRKSA